MKIALYIEDGLEQIVLTPETATEKGILGKLSDGSRSLSIIKGSFFKVRGGWTRHARAWSDGMYGGSSGDDESTMIVLSEERVEEPAADVGEDNPPLTTPSPKDERR